MIDFIVGLNKEARFSIKDKIVVLRKGDSKKGFQHILERHYCSGCPGELLLNDILKFDLYLQRAIKLSENGVTNKKLEVYEYIKNQKNFKIVLKKEDDENYVVTFYKKE